jgi:hypothetical protein
MWSIINTRRSSGSAGSQSCVDEEKPARAVGEGDQSWICASADAPNNYSLVARTPVPAHVRAILAACRLEQHVGIEIGAIGPTDCARFGVDEDLRKECRVLEVCKHTTRSTDPGRQINRPMRSIREPELHLEPVADSNPVYAWMHDYSKGAIRCGG